VETLFFGFGRVCEAAMKRLLTIWMTVCLLPVAAGAIEYHVDLSKNNQVVFFSKSTLKDFEVRTAKMDGYVYWDGEDSPPEAAQLKNSKIYFEVQLNTLDAGNSMFNRHMKEDYLETEKFPYATYEASITRIEQNPDSSYSVYTTGQFSIHGVAHKVNIIGTAKPKGNDFNITCDFSVKMSDHNIDLPKMLIFSADEDIDVSLDFYIKPAH